MSGASLNISCAPSSRRDGTGGAGSVLSCAALLASALARAAISSSFTTLRLRRLGVVSVANGSSSAVVSFGEGSGFGDKSSTSNGGGETERAREVTGGAIYALPVLHDL